MNPLRSHSTRITIAPPDTTTLNHIADKLARGQFIQILSTPQGLPYCPIHLIAMTNYLWKVRFHYVNTQRKLDTLKRTLNTLNMSPGRREMIREAMARVFPPTGVFPAYKFDN